ncbi:leucine-rich repeat domain-containing protein [uncultured Prevotella sp.]|uniref:leucine-rich repeat domain-containing protein n=1 Tax=uncultured Prevotella sp. TaxID=159272 RepID=UPI0025D02FF7|nr:leucine-rich repeat domain-containing protein [uncultured Prevotella sp.]
MAASAHDIEVPNGDGVTIYYNFTNDSTELEVTFRGDNYIPFEYTGNVIIPEEVTYMNRIYKVTSIGNWTFYDCGLISITIPNSVTSIGENAFAFCSGLTSVTIPNSVTSIGKKAFYGCFGLTSVTIPNSITSIGSGVFQSCSGLTSIVIPNSVTSISEDAFYGCSGLTSITIPNSITSIGDYAFAHCSGLTSVSIPNSVTSIGRAAFQECFSLASISIPNSVTSIQESAFHNCFGLTSVIIPNSVTSIGSGAFYSCTGLTSVTFPSSVTSIGGGAFHGCTGLTSVIIPNSVTSIETFAFAYCSNLTSVTIGNSVMSIGSKSFSNCSSLTSVTVLNPTPIAIKQNVFTSRKNATLYVPAASIDAYRNVSPWNEFGAIVPLEDQVAYRPFVEDGKVWKVGSTTGISDGVVKMVEYYYLDGDTIVDGRTCKQMMCQRYVSPDHPDYDDMIQIPSLRNIGAWYEEDKKVYFYNAQNKQYKMMYDFSLEANESFLIDDYYSYVIGPKQTGGLDGFKGVYRDVMWYDEEEPYYNTTWLEGVGGIDGPTVNVYYGKEGHGLFLMSCSVGDEVIYLNDDYEDGASIDAAGARKDRFDFVHIIKPRPKVPSKQEESDASIMAKAPMREAEEPIYGEYNELQLDINLNPLADAYMVSITNESGKAVYEKAINAGSIVGLNIDISAYAKGRYTVTMENSLESFTGEFEVQTTGITEVTYNKVKARTDIFNLQGRRLNAEPKHGVYIKNGKKVIK